MRSYQLSQAHTIACCLALIMASSAGIGLSACSWFVPPEGDLTPVVAQPEDLLLPRLAEPSEVPTTVVLTSIAPIQQLSTPQLIEQAFAQKKITASQRLLYLAYAVYDYGALPAQFRSNIGWRGTSVVGELGDTVSSKETMCVLDPAVQKELLRLIPRAVICEP
jgi:hypothetical protein